MRSDSEIREAYNKPECSIIYTKIDSYGSGKSCEDYVSAYKSRISENSPLQNMIYSSEKKAIYLPTENGIPTSTTTLCR